MKSVVNVLKANGLSNTIANTFLDPTKMYNMDMYTYANFILPSLKEPLNQFLDDLINNSEMGADDVVNELRDKMHVIFGTYSHGKLRKASTILKWFKKNYDDKLSSILSNFNYTTNNYIKSASNGISIKYNRDVEEIIVKILTVSAFDIKMDSEMKISKNGIDFTLKKSDYVCGNIEFEEEPLHGHYKTIGEIFIDTKFKAISKHASLYNAIFATIIDLKLLLNLSYHLDEMIYSTDKINIFTSSKMILVKNKLISAVLNFTLDKIYNMIDRVNNYEDYKFKNLSEINLDDNIKSLDEFMNERFSNNNSALEEMIDRNSVMYLCNLTLNIALRYISIKSIDDIIGLKYIDLFNLIKNSYYNLKRHGADNMEFNAPTGSIVKISIGKPNENKMEFKLKIDIDDNEKEFILNEEMNGKLPDESKFYFKNDGVLFNTERASLEVEYQNKDIVEVLLFYTICVLKLFNSNLYLDNSISDDTINKYLFALKEELFAEHIQSNVVEKINLNEIRDIINTTIVNDINKISSKIKENIGDIDMEEIREFTEQLRIFNAEMSGDIYFDEEDDIDEENSDYAE